MHGVINLLKPPGMTSHDAVAFVRRVTGVKRVGHTGTLDPAAAGVLPICIGQATRLVEYLQGGTKEYVAEATFGYETDTGDAVGQTISEGDTSHLDLESLRQALDPFRGTIVQTPPVHSAIKVGGKKLYELARRGDTEVEIPTREVFISALFITKFWNTPHHPRAMLKVECSGGTYIRSLVRDIGRGIGCRATMTFLVRTRSGAFEVNEAKTIEEVASNSNGALIPIEEVLMWCAQMSWVNDEAVQALSQGRIYHSPVTWQRLTNSRNYDPVPRRAMKAGLIGTIGSQRSLFLSSDNTVAVLASRVRPLASQQYKPEKVFFLDTPST